MFVNEINKEWWSLDSDDSSINQQFECLAINSSSDTSKGENIIIARGNPALKKPISPNDQKLKVTNTKKSKTSTFVLPILQDSDCNLELSKSSGYNSSQSPTKDFSEVQNDVISSQCLFQPNTSPYIRNLFNETKKRQLKNLIKIRLFSRKGLKEGNEQCTFEFGDTILIKSCRTGQVSGVQTVINQLLKDKILILIDQQNSANETPLSIATYQMNEIMIRLLIKYYASPNLQLTMNNNVLQLAAAMTNDVDRRTLTYLICAIKYYNPGCLYDCLTNKNIFNEDVSDILRRYRDRITDNILEYQCIQSHIDGIQYLLNSYI